MLTSSDLLPSAGTVGGQPSALAALAAARAASGLVHPAVATGGLAPVLGQATLLGARSGSGSLSGVTSYKVGGVGGWHRQRGGGAVSLIHCLAVRPHTHGAHAQLAAALYSHHPPPRPQVTVATADEEGAGTAEGVLLVVIYGEAGNTGELRLGGGDGGFGRGKVGCWRRCWLEPARTPLVAGIQAGSQPPSPCLEARASAPWRHARTPPPARLRRRARLRCARATWGAPRRCA